VSCMCPASFGPAVTESQCFGPCCCCQLSSKVPYHQRLQQLNVLLDVDKPLLGKLIQGRKTTTAVNPGCGSINRAALTLPAQPSYRCGNFRKPQEGHDLPHHLLHLPVAPPLPVPPRCRGEAVPLATHRQAQLCGQQQVFQHLQSSSNGGSAHGSGVRNLQWIRGHAMS